jgi:hypothetical protein
VLGWVYAFFFGMFKVERGRGVLWGKCRDEGLRGKW